MEDIRQRNYKKRLNRRVKISKFYTFLKNNWIKILFIFIIFSIIFFPTIFGGILGDWFNKLVTAFIENITF